MGLGFLQAAGILVVAIGVLGVAFALAWIDATPRNDVECFIRATLNTRLEAVFAGVESAAVVCGHTHLQFDRRVAEHRIINAGSVGMPFAGRRAPVVAVPRQPGAPPHCGARRLVGAALDRRSHGGFHCAIGRACYVRPDQCRGGGRRRVVCTRAGEKMTAQYLEDYAVGQIYWSGRKRVVKDEIVAFAKEFDPQFYHLDEVAALKSPFKGLAASGWHTAAMTMRLMVDGEFRPAGGILGVGFDQLSWSLPVRPGDELRVKSEILEVRPSKSKPDRGMIRVKNTTLNQNDEVVQMFTGNLLVPRRSPAA